MKFTLFKETLTQTRTKLALSTLLLLMSFVINIILGIAIIVVSGKDRIIVVPPAINKSFWLDSSSLSEEYLEQMSSYITYLVSTVNPVNVDAQHKALLTMVAPEDLTRLTADFRTIANKIKNEHVEQTFDITGYEIDAPAKRVGVIGNLNVTLNQKKLEPKQVTYLIEYSYIQGKVYLKSVKSSEQEVKTVKK